MRIAFSSTVSPATDKQTFVSKLTKKISQIYPRPLRTFLARSLFVMKPPRFAQGERIDGSYDIETGEIILWGPNLEDEEGLLLIITHEWGHKIYHEWLNEDEIKEWLQVRCIEKIDFDLKRNYPSFKQPEEEFCTLFSLISLAKYWDINGMKERSKKLSLKISGSFPRATQTVERHISKNSKLSRKNPRNQITHKEVERLKAWVLKAISE